MKKSVLLPLVFLLLVGVLPCQVQAQEEISASSTVQGEFPTSLTFGITAESPGNITRIILCYRVRKITTARVTTLIELEFEQAPEVEASWEWDMRRSTLPPGAEVEYSWRVEDAFGNELVTDWEVVEFDDDRYSWSSLVEGEVTIFWYRGAPSFSGQLMEAAQEALVKLAEDTGAHLDQGVEVYIYASSAELREAMVYPQEWMGAVAFCEYGTIAIGVAPEDVAWGRRTMTHELAHLVTYQMTSNPYADIPRWLDEGLSMYAEGDLEPTFGVFFDWAISEDSLLSVQTLSSNFPADPDEARLSYAESYSLVEFLIDDYGSDKMLQLLEVFKRGSTYDGALEEVYGFDTFGLDNRWRLSLGLEPRLKEPVSTPTATPGAGFFGCQAVSAGSSHSGSPVFVTLGLVLVPGIGVAIRAVSRRGRR